MKTKKKDLEVSKKLKELYKEVKNDLTEIQFWKLFQPKDALKALESSTKMLKTVMNNIPHLISWKDTDLRYLGCNTNFANFIGIPDPNHSIGKKNQDLILNVVNISEIDQIERRILKVKQAQLNNIEIWQNKEGEKIYFEINRIPLTNKKGKVIGLLISQEDITERLLADVKLKESQSQLQELNRELENKVRERTKELEESELILKQQNIELKKIDRLKNDFISMAAHELKTPLISISGYTEYVLMKYQDELNPEIKKDMEVVQRNIERLKKYMDQLLDVMKIDEHKLKLNKVLFNVNTTIQECIDELSYLINEKHHRIEADLEQELLLRADRERLFQVVSNLLSNSIKFTPKNGIIKIYSEARDGQYLFEIKDSGVGLEKYQILNIFDKFESTMGDLDEDFNKNKGTGLGLYISRGIIEAHGGSIILDSEGINRGTKVLFSIPNE